MPDEKPVGADAVAQGDPVGESKQGQPFKVLATPEDAEHWKAKVLEEPLKRIAHLEKQLKARETEEEKRTREADEARKADLEKIQTAAERKAELMGELRGRGLSIEQAKRLADVVGPDFDTVESAVALLEKDYGLSFNKTQAPKLGPGQGGNPQQGGFGFTPEEVRRSKGSRSLEEHTRWMREHANEINAASGIELRVGQKG